MLYKSIFAHARKRWCHRGDKRPAERRGKPESREEPESRGKEQKAAHRPPPLVYVLDIGKIFLDLTYETGLR